MEKEEVTERYLGEVLPIKFLGYKSEKTRVIKGVFFTSLYEVENCTNSMNFTCSSGNKYVFIKGKTKFVPVKDAEFLLRVKDRMNNYCFEIDV